MVTSLLLNNIKAYILNPLVIFLFGLALILFLYGLVEFLWDVNGKKDEGKQTMLWGIIGIAIMLSVYGIEELIINTIMQLATGSKV
ncbi:MAG: hypothetical protein NTV48_03425 [Candidatus Vogelbacteria bacterium]|nr:hypothetical protein [Candidatus Vogelbacteria bacterium]